MKHLPFISLETSQKRLAEFECWYQTPLGRDLLADQRKVVSYQIENFFGVHQLSMQISHRLPIANDSPFAHRIECVGRWDVDMPENTLVCASEEISLSSDSVDLVIMHHTLDFAAAPHQALREAARVLRSGGHLVIIGFNPTGLWGLVRFLKRGQGVPWMGRFISSRRLEDWLELLDFRIAGVKYRFPRFPTQPQSIKTVDDVDVVRPLPFFMGAYYSLVSRKQKGAMTLVRKPWSSAKVVGMPVANGFNRTSASPDEKDLV